MKNKNLQILSVSTNSWHSPIGKMTLFESSQVIKDFAVVVGKQGMALDKKEGDQKSPAGVFMIGSAFAPSRPQGLKLDFIQITEDSEAIDDPESRHYNHIIRRGEVEIDWNSSEKLIDYSGGIVVEYNLPKPVPYKGSCIFIHEWKGRDIGTAGCTAMSREDFDFLLGWLDPKKQPILVQFPICYTKFIQGGRYEKRVKREDGTCH